MPRNYIKLAYKSTLECLPVRESLQIDIRLATGHWKGLNGYYKGKAIIQI
jgi:hypothetical protein